MKARIIRTMKFTVVSLFTLMLFALSVAAQPPQDRPPNNDNRRIRLLARQLEFTQEQRQQVRGILQEQRPLLRAAQQRVRKARLAVDKAIYSETLDEQLLAQSIGEFTQAQAEVTKIKLRSELQIRKLLTPQQLETFIAIRRRAAENRKQRQQRRRQGMKDRRP